MINETQYSKAMKNNPSLVEQGPQGNWSRAARQVIAAGALLLSMSSAIAQTAVSTLAGSSPAIQSGNVDATGTAARFNALSSVAVDAAGNIYIADAGNHKIRKVTPAGVVTTLAGSGAQGNANGNGAAATFNTPSGVATDNTFVYVADTGNHAIRKIEIANLQAVTTLAGSTASPGVFGTTNDTGALARFWNPSGLAVSGTDLYVADTSNHTIRKVTAAGVVTTFAGTAGTTGSADLVGVLATFQNPSAIAAEGTTNLYVADRTNHIIRKIVIGTAAVTTLAGTGNGTGGSTDSTGAAASFKSPGGLVVSGVNLFVADTGNNIIRQIVHATGVVTTIAGTAGSIGTTDAIGTAARFQGPTGIGVSTGGTLYIADTNNHTLRTGGAAVAPIVSNPAAATVAVGANPTFTVTTTGNPTPTIQWERQAANTVGFAVIPTSATYTGVGTATLTVTNVTLAMSGDQFRASVTNGVGAAVVSATPAALTVQLAPVITSAAAANFSVNAAGTFTVTASGSPTPTFSVLAGTFPPWATLNTTTGVISGTPTNNTGSPFNFTIRASNTVNPVSDQAFVLTVQNGAVIGTPPASTAVALGANAQFTVVASGTPATFTYQWYRSAGGTGGFLAMTDVAGVYTGSTTATLTVSGTTLAMNADQFRVDVSNGIGATANSVAATLTVQQAPVITSLNSTIFALNVAGSFSFQATGSPTPTFSVPAGTFPPWATLNATTGALTGAPTNDTGSPFSFTVRATSAGVAAVSDQAFTLSVTPTGASPGFTTQPASVSASIGDPVVFTVVATGSPAPTYQWQRQPAAGGGFTNITEGGGYTGVTTATLTIAAATTGMSGDQFQCVASNTVNTLTSATSNIATLTVSTGTIITTVAGTVGVIATVNGTGTAAQFTNPSAIASDSAGNLYVADPTAHVIRKITTAGVVTTFAGTVGAPGSADGAADVARFNGPSGVAVDGSGNVFVADTNNHTIRGISASGTVQTLAGTAGSIGSVDGLGAAARFNYPFGVAVDSAGTAYVSDTFNHLIRRITQNGTVSTMGGAVGVKGSIDGGLTVSRFNNPTGIAVDSTGNVYVADSTNATIRKISTGNVTSTYAGTAGSFGSANGAALTVARFNQPNGVAVDSTGVVYVADTFSHTIRRITVAGDVSTLAGLAGSSGSVDGTGAAARFNQPNGIAVDGAANLYIADSQNRTIRRSGATTAPTITTQPVNVALAPGGNVTFTVAASGSPAPTVFQWQRQPAGTTGFVNITNDATYGGATTATLTVTAITAAMHNDQFRAVVTNYITPDGTSNAATLSTVIAAPVFTSVAAAQFRATEAGTFTVAATGNPAPTFTATGLPAWLTLNATTGVLSGTAPDTTGSPLSLTITATNGTPVSQTFALTVAPFIVAPIFTSGASAQFNATEVGSFTVTATGAPAPTFAATGLPAWLTLNATTGVLSGTAPDAAGSPLALTITASNGLSATQSFALSIRVKPVFTTAANATFNALQAGTFTVAATGAPAPTFTATGLPAWLTLNATTGVLSGTAPDSVGSPLALTLNANNGLSTTQSFALTIISAPTISASPIGGTIARGQTGNFSVTAAGTGPFSYQWRKDGAAISGATSSTLVVAGAQSVAAGSYSVTVTNSAGSVTSAAAVLNVNTPAFFITQPRSQTALAGAAVTFSVEAGGSPAPTYQWRLNGSSLPGANSSTLTLFNVQANNSANYDVLISNGVGGGLSSLATLNVVASASAPVITASPAPRTVVVGGSTTLSVSASAAPAPTYQWRKSGVAISGATGATLQLANLQLSDSVNYDVVVTNSAGSATSSSAAVTVVRRSFAGTYFGSFGGSLGNYAIYLRGDNSGVFLGYLPGNSTGLRNTEFSVTDLGAFQLTQGAVSMSGTIATDGSITGLVGGVSGAALSGARSPDTGLAQSAAGAYQAAAANTSSSVYGIVSASGQAFVLVQTSTTSDGGQSSLDGDNRITITTARQSIIATIAPDTSGLTVVVTSGSTATTFTGASEAVLATQRLANISTRARVGTGDSVTIAGFVISGQESKPVLIRAIGPTLRGLGIATALAAPKLELYRSGTSTPIASNTGWSTGGNLSAIIAATNQAGAFALGATSADSVIFATLAPGAYTAVISSANGTPGVALAEVYDLSAPAVGQKLFNISTRANTGSGDSTLIAGIVVSGSVPKRVLIRGVGPTLASLGVVGALAQPQLTVIKDGVTVAANSNWSTSPDAAAIAAVSAQVGAFALGATSADAAMIVSLAPGNYSAQVSGANGTSGIAIIEIYELP